MQAIAPDKHGLKQLIESFGLLKRPLVPCDGIAAVVYMADYASCTPFRHDAEVDAHSTHSFAMRLPQLDAEKQHLVANVASNLANTVQVNKLARSERNGALLGQRRHASCMKILRGLR